ncbi:MAG: hypothetical protein H0W47_02995 [Polaromonas sp.]|uniref:hypothetical protein n=1 Tax=Polaromonas sp. TaxID=1869339 RepID=UPI0018183237|nr:hypothetical protein [Polaromonas sp.]MBA3592751.1 hypothetical protein [Polaromonas sp.]
MSLQFLEFDYSEDPQGSGSFDAMASVRPAQLAALRAEIAEVLEWAETTFSGQRGPLDDGGEWDVDLHERVDGASPPWHVLTLCISGNASFCAAFGQRFGLEESF